MLCLRLWRLVNTRHDGEEREGELEIPCPVRSVMKTEALDRANDDFKDLTAHRNDCERLQPEEPGGARTEAFMSLHVSQLGCHVCANASVLIASSMPFEQNSSAHDSYPATFVSRYENKSALTMAVREPAVLYLPFEHPPSQPYSHISPP